MGWQDDEVISAGGTVAPGTEAARAAWEADDVVGGRDFTARPAAASPPADPDKKEVPLAVRPFVGANRFIATAAGAPVDAAAAIVRGAGAEGSPTTAVLNSMLSPQARELRRRVYSETTMGAAPIGGSESIKEAMGALPMGGANPDDVRPAENTTEKVLEGAGEGAAAMLVPGLGAEAMLARSAKAVESFGNMALNLLKGGGAVSNTLIGGVGGAVGEVAAEAVPDNANVSVAGLDFSPQALKDAARLGGNLVGGGVAAGLETGARAAGRAAQDVVRSATEAPEIKAARDIVARADNPQKFRQDVTRAAEADPLVPGSTPTTFQVTGDLGVGAMERDVAASPSGVPRFAERRQEQNIARLAELDKLSQPDADPVAVADYVRKRLRAIDEAGGLNVDTSRRALDESLAAAGGRRFDNDADYGSALRSDLAAVRKPVRDAEGALWDAIDPDGTAMVQGANLFRDTVKKLADSISKAAARPKGEEKDILDVIQSLDSTESFKVMTDLRSRLTTAIRDERKNGTDQAAGRMIGVLRELDAFLDDSVAQIAANPENRVALAARLEAELGAREAGSLEGQRISAGAGPGMGDEGLFSNGEGVVRPVPGGEGQANGRPGIFAGDQGLPADPGVLKRYAAARAATKERATLYNEGPVGEVLKPGGQYGSFRMTASNVAGRLFDRPEALEAYIAAARDNPAALATMRDYAAFSLRQAAVKDGLLSPQKYQKWVDDHAYVFRRFPELGERFSNVRAAQSTLDAALASQKEALIEYQSGAIKRLLNTQDPELVIVSALKRPGEFEALAKEIGNDTAALAGLKRAVVDYMMKQARGTAEAGTSGEPQINAATLQKFFLNNKRSLSAIFDKEELASMERVTADLQRANRSVAAVRIPGGSNTAQDTGSRVRSILTDMVQRYGGKAAGATAGTTVGGPVGAAAGFAVGAVADAMRAARADRIDKAIVEMMLDPKMAAEWIAKIPPQSGSAAAEAFAQKMRALAIAQITKAIDEATEGENPRD